VGLSVYLLALATRSIVERRRGIRRAAPRPTRGVEAILIGYAAVMAVVAGLAVWAQVAFWVGMASWSALVAVATVVVQRRRRPDASTG